MSAARAALALALLAPLPAATAQDASASAATIAERGEDTMIASGLGTVSVVSPDGETLGDVSDTILSRDGRIVALVVGVGGFLGLAEKPVAVLWEHLSVRPTEDGFEIVCELDRATLEAAPRYREGRD